MYVALMVKIVMRTLFFSFFITELATKRNSQFYFNKKGSHFSLV